MTKDQARSIAKKNKLGNVVFQEKVSLNGGRLFEVGYVVAGSRLDLFCKRQPGTADNAFYLCNEFRELEPK